MGKNLITVPLTEPLPTRGQNTQIRRRVEPLELALREGQLACAAVLIEGGARISERALKAVKLEPAGAVATNRRCGVKLDRSRAEYFWEMHAL